MGVKMGVKRLKLARRSRAAMLAEGVS